MRYLLPAILLAAVAIGAAGSEPGRTTPSQSSSASALSPLEAVNELLAVPWQGLAKQRAQDAEREIVAALDGRKLVDSDGSESGFKWKLSLTLKDVRASIDTRSPPAFTQASDKSLALELPRGAGWDVAISGDVKGRASVKTAGQTLFSWSPGLHLGLQIKNFKVVAQAALDTSRPNRPKLAGSTIRPSLTLAGGGFLPVSVPLSFTFQTEGEKLVLRGHMTGVALKEELSGLDAKLTADLVVSLLPRAVVDPFPVGPAGLDYEIPLGEDGRTLRVELNGKLKVRLKKVGKLTVPFKGFDLTIPFPSPHGLDELLAPLAGNLPQPWGDGKPAPAGTVPDPATLAAPVAELEAGAAKHMPHGGVLSFDFAGRKGDPFSAYTYGRDVDSTIWTGHYLAAESFRYAVTQSPAALSRVQAAVEGLRRLFWVTSDAVETIGEDGTKVLAPVTGGRRLSGPSGILARTAKPDSDSRAFTRTSKATTSGPLEQRPCHYVKPEGGWLAADGRSYPTFAGIPPAVRGQAKPVGPIWYGWGCGDNWPVSKDQYIGAMLGLGVAWKLVPDAGVRKAAGELIEDALDYLLRNDWNVRLPPDGRIQTSFLGDFPKQLALLRIGKTVKPGKYGDDYDKVAAAAELAWIPVWLSSFDPIFQYYKFNLSHAAFVTALVLEESAAQRQRWHDSYQLLWGPVAHHRNAYFDLARILAEPPATRPAILGSPSQANVNVTLAGEVKTVLGEWVRRWTLVKGRWGPLNRVGDAAHQLRLWPDDFGTFQTVDGKTYCLAKYALPVDGRRGANAEFVWEHAPFRLSVGAESCKKSPRPDTEQILKLDSKQSSREGASVDYLLAYWLAVYLELLPAPASG